MSQPELNQSRREFLERMKKTAIWAAPAVTMIALAPRKAMAYSSGEGS